MTTYLGRTFDIDAAPQGGPLSALDELKQRRIWVAWKIVVRPDKDGNPKPTKPPVNPHTGFGASHSDPATWGSYDQAAAMAERRHLPGVGIVLQDDDDLTGIDLDKCRNPETGEIEPWALEVLDFAESYAEVSPSGSGIRIIARGKVPATVKCDPAHVEIYRAQRYLTVTEQQIAGSPDDIRPAPKTLAALMDRVERLKPRPAAPAGQMQPTALAAPAQSFHAVGGSDFFRRVNDAALASLASWVPAIFPTAKYQPGTGAYRVSSRSLGRSLQEDLSLAPEGVKDFGVADMGDARLGARTPIDVLIEWGGHVDPLDAARWLCDRMGQTPEAMGWGAQDAAMIAMGDETARALIERADGTLYDAETGEIVEGARPPEEGDADDLPERLSSPPGLVGEIARYTMGTAMYPKRGFAIGTALALVSSVAGRYWCGPTESPTHLYILCVGPSGSGKENGLKIAKKLIDEAELGMLLGPGNFMSGSAISNHVAQHPLSLCVIDEMQMLIKKVHGKRVSSFEEEISKLLRELWNINFGTFKTAAWASKASEAIHAPSLSIFGVGAKEETWQSFNADSINNGFINRFLVFGADETDERDPLISSLAEAPKSITHGLRMLFCGGTLIKDGMKGGGGGMTVLMPSNRVTIRKADWADERAKEAYRAYQDKLKLMRRSDPDCKP